MKLNENERLDDLGVNNLKIIQNEKLYCFNSDTILLSDFVETKKDDIVCDFGTGSGIIPILLKGKRDLKHIYAIEVQDVFCELAKRNFELNNMENDITILKGNITDVVPTLHEKGVTVVVCNPPYFDNTTPIKNECEEIKIARHEILIDLKGIIQNASKLLKTGGRFFMVHKTKRLNEIFKYVNEFNLKINRIRNVYPNKMKNADTCLIECVKDKNPELVVLSPLYVREVNGEYTDEIKEIYSREKR